VKKYEEKGSDNDERADPAVAGARFKSGDPATAGPHSKTAWRWSAGWRMLLRPGRGAPRGQRQYRGGAAATALPEEKGWKYAEKAEKDNKGQQAPFKKGRKGQLRTEKDKKGQRKKIEDHPDETKTEIWKAEN